jgi:nitrate reductase gamma subunit
MIEASREIFWNVPTSLSTIFYIVSVIAVAIFFIGSWLRISIWLKGKDDPQALVSRKSALGLVMMSLSYIFSRDCLLAKRVMERSKVRGVMLIFVYWGFIILFIGTLTVAIDHYPPLDILKGRFYLYFSLILDIAGGLLLIGLLFFILRRYIPSKDVIISGWDDAVILIFMLLIVITGFSVEGIRLARLNPPSMDFSPVGAIFSVIFKALDQAALQSLYRIFWVFHALSALSFISYIPFSKQFHMFAAQITTSEASLRESTLSGIVHD